MSTVPVSALEAAYDVAVIGSGAAGLVAAIRAAHAGLRVVVLERTGSWAEPPPPVAGSSGPRRPARPGTPDSATPGRPGSPTCVRLPDT